MKKILFICAILLVSLTFAQKKVVPQKNNSKKIITTGKSNSTYYNLSKSKPVTLTVSGPGELIVYTRTVVKEKKQASRPFILKYKVDDKRIKTRKVPKKQKSLRSRLKKDSKVVQHMNCEYQHENLRNYYHCKMYYKPIEGLVGNGSTGYSDAIRLITRLNLPSYKVAN